MAYSISSFSSLLVSLLLVFQFVSLSSARPSTKADLISDICSITQNPSLCLQVLKSDPRAAKADLKGLGQISLDKAQTNAKQTSTLIASLSKGVTDPKLKGRYSTCVENYGDAIDDLNEARQALSSGDIPTFRTKASAALNGQDTCEDSFEGPPAEPPQLKEANKKLEGLCSIVLAVGSRLAGSN